MFKSQNDCSGSPTAGRPAVLLRVYGIKPAILLFAIVLIMSPDGTARAATIAVVGDTAQSFTSSGLLDKTFSVPQVGDGRAFVFPASLTLGANMETPAARNPDGSIFNLGVYNMESKLTSTFTFSGPGTISAHFIAHGTMTLPATDLQGDGIVGTARILVSSLPGVSGTLSDQVAFTTSPGSALQGIPLVPPGTLNVSLSADFSFAVTPGNLSRDLTFDLRLSGGNGASLDFSHTAQVIFDLPPGVTVTSDGGFVGAPVPEPSGVCLAGLGISCLAGIHYWNRRRNGLAAIRT
jgi:hypothetical protein